MWILLESQLTYRKQPKLSQEKFSKNMTTYWRSWVWDTMVVVQFSGILNHRSTHPLSRSCLWKTMILGQIQLLTVIWNQSRALPPTLLVMTRSGHNWRRPVQTCSPENTLPMVLTSSGGYRSTYLVSGRYASYWNVFLLEQECIPVGCVQSAAVAIGGVCPWGVCPGGVYLGGCLLGSVSPRVSALVHAGIHLTLWTEWQTLVKILPCRNYIGDGKYYNFNRVFHLQDELGV